MNIVRLIAALFVLSSFVVADTWTTPVQVPMQVSSWDWCMSSISHDGSRLFFASDSDGIANGPHGLYYALSVGGIWSAQEFLGTVVNDSARYNLSPCIGYDDTTLYFMRRGSGDSIWVTYFTAGAWQAPVLLDNAINQLGARNPAISKDGQTLYFSSDRTGGYGGYDIWKSVRSGGVWQAPVNLGPMVNTSSWEVEPSIAGNDTDFVYERTNGSMQDTMNIWHIRLGTGYPPDSLFPGHYMPYPHYGSYCYRAPCISWDGQAIYMTYMPFNAEQLSYIYVSNRIVGVAGNPGKQELTVFRLNNNQPNPARSWNTISFSLPQDGAYGLRVFNMAGQQVKDLSGNGRSGTNNIKWNVTSIPNGVYLYQLGFEGMKVAKRMVVLK